MTKTGTVTVAHVDLTPCTEREIEARGWLDEPERERWGRYLADGPRRRFALCRAALRAILCNRLGCRNEHLTFGASRHGKPFARVRGEPAPVSFNVSHSGEHGLIAFAPDGRLGVDVEERVARRDLDVLIEAVLGPDEQAEVRSAEGRRKIHLFFGLWTAKEALIKAQGQGLAFDMSRFEIPLAMRRGAKTSPFRFPEAPTIRWRLVDLSDERFAAAVAYESRDSVDGESGTLAGDTGRRRRSTLAQEEVLHRKHVESGGEEGLDRVARGARDRFVEVVERRVQKRGNAGQLAKPLDQLKQGR